VERGEGGTSGRQTESIGREGSARGGNKVLYRVWEPSLGLEIHRAVKPGRIGGNCFYT
jgi:hypothetical protein